jgi:hypothetical protein
MRTGMLVLSVMTAHEASNWIRVSTPSVEIFNHANENTARPLLNRLETLRSIFRESSIAESPEPLRVFLFSSEKEFSKYRAEPSTAGFYTRDVDKDFIVLGQSFALNRIAAHEYLHMVIRHSSPLLPAWLEEGLPEFYSTAPISGTKLRIGDPIPLLLNLLQSEPWLSAEELGSGGSKDCLIFYAESWALVHMLSLGPGWRGSLPQFIQLLAQDRPQSEAFFVAFGASMTDALAALHSYRNDPKVVTSSAPPVEDVKLSPTTKLDPLEISLTFADLALHTGRRSLARSLFEHAAQDHPESTAAIAGLGFLALAEDRKEDAKRYFEKAIAAGYKNAETFFQMAALTKDSEFLKKPSQSIPTLPTLIFCSASTPQIKATSLRPSIICTARRPLVPADSSIGTRWPTHRPSQVIAEPPPKPRVVQRSSRLPIRKKRWLRPSLNWPPNRPHPRQIRSPP